VRVHGGQVPLIVLWTHDDGIEPLSLFSHSISFSKPDSAPIDGGMVPPKWLPYRWTRRSFESSPMVDGMAESARPGLLKTPNSVSSVRLPIEGGTDPTRLLGCAVATPPPP
jgi:hypothetical protein